MEETTLALARALDPLTPEKDLPPLDSGLTEQAMKEGVAGILYKSLLASGRFESLAQSNRQRLQAFYYQTLRMNLRLMHAFKALLYQANTQGVDVLVLQGMDLLNEPYEDIGLRPMTDIDLRVSKKDYDKIVQIFAGLGYERDPVYPSSFKQGPILFDVHTHILWADRIQARNLLLGRSEEDLIERVREVEIEGQRALCLSRHDQVLYLSLHAFKHRAERLIWLFDIKRIVEGWNAADWEGFLVRAAELKQSNTVSYIAFLLMQIFRVKIPKEALELLQKKPLGFLERKILRDRVRKGALPHWGPVLLFSSQLKPGKRLLFYFETLFPRAEVLRQVFPSSPSLKPWQLYSKRVLQLLGMLRRALS